MAQSNLSSISEKDTKSIATSDKDFWIIDGILENSELTIKKIYQLHFPKIQKLVWSFKNTSLDAYDIFQEGLTRAILNIREGKFRSESSFSTYFYAICRNICRSQLQQAKKAELHENILIEEEDSRFELLNIILDLKSELGDKCKEIIDLRFAMVETDHENPNKCNSFDLIAEKLNITAVNARQRFKRCLDQLRIKAASIPELEDYL